MMAKKPKAATERQDGKSIAKAVAGTPPRREPNERETALIDSAKAANKLRPARAEIEKREASEPGALAIGPRHCDEQGGSYTLVDAFATTSEYFTSESLIQIAEMSVRDGEVSNDKVNAKLALMGGIAPRDELEAALGLQMVATHDLSMLMLLRAKNASHLEGMREYGNLATKLTRTFTAQMKALSEWRRGGEQVVRHIHVYEGGQAVVAETVNVGGQNGSLAGQCHAPFATLPRPDSGRIAVPRASGEGKEAVPDARWEESGAGAG